MKHRNGKIVEATENELFRIYVERGWGEVLDFREFCVLCEQKGTKIIKEDSRNACSSD